MSFASGEVDVWGMAGSVADSPAFTQGSNDAAEVMGSFQETAPRRTAENTVKPVRGS